MNPYLPMDEPLIFDSHAHYDDPSFDEDREALLRQFPADGICAVINCGASIPTSQKAIAFSEAYDYIWAAVGVHPHDSEKTGEFDPALFEELIRHERVAAIGEIGLDYYYDFSRRDIQKKWFEAQLRFAKEHSLPVIIHDREAHKDTMDLLKRYQPKGVVHCFSGSVEMARDVVKLGMYVGLGGSVTFKNARTPKEVAADLPLDRLLTETDAPYLAPAPYRGKRCDSRHIGLVAAEIGVIRDENPLDILKIARDNGAELFGIALP